MTLTELLVVIAVMVLLMSVSVPTAKKLADSFDATTGVRQLINAALANGRAIAVREQAYAGVRFQQGAEGETYMIFIVHDFDTTHDEEGYLAVVGRKPIALPKDISVSDGKSVIFSPAGKLTTRRVRCMARSANDTIFNSQAKLDSGVALFLEDLDADEQDSVQEITISNANKGKSWTDYISPYTGELILEYK